MNGPTLELGRHDHEVTWSAVLTVDPRELEDKIKAGWLEWGLDWPGGIERTDDGIITFGDWDNLVVDTGITRLQNLGWGIGGVSQVMNCMGVDNGTGTPGTTSTQVGTIPVADTSTTACRIQAFDSTATQTTKVVSQIATFTQAGVGFVMKHLTINFIASGSLPVSSTGTPAVVGTNGAVVAAVPANSLHSCTNPFTIDLTSFTTWSQAITATVTGVGT